MENTENKPQVIVKDVWKLYGKDAKKVFTKKLMQESKASIQKKTGCIVGMKNIES